MKRLRLDIGSLQGVQELTRDQLKKVLGGETGTCAVYAPNGNTGMSWNNGGSNPNYTSLTFSMSGGSISELKIYGVTADNAQKAAQNAGAGAHWCCSTCDTASWYNPQTTIPETDPIVP